MTTDNANTNTIIDIEPNPITPEESEDAAADFFMVMIALAGNPISKLNVRIDSSMNNDGVYIPVNTKNIFDLAAVLNREFHNAMLEESVLRLSVNEGVILLDTSRIVYVDLDTCNVLNHI